MKYIRTKDGIYEVKREDILCGFRFYDVEIGECFNRVREDFVVSQADTIEELCDVYVSVYEEQLDNEIFWANKYTPTEVKNFYTGYIPKEVYGAIWTDKGLIYVAKMNSKGELELL